ncbi:RHS repeat domain-containing protein [Bacteroides fragilis]
MSVESEYNAYGERTRVGSSLGADTELSYDRLGLVGGIKATVGKPEADEASAYGDSGGDVRPWESTIGRDDAGREVERFATGGIRITTDYNDMGLVRSRHVRSGNRHTGWRSYRWDVGARLMSMRGNLSPEPVIFDYDSMCNLVRGDYSMYESVFRTPDKVGNLYREDGCKGREYDRGGRLLWDGEYHYRYDCEGNLVHKSRRDVSVPESGHTEKKGWLGMLFSADDADKNDNSLETDPFAGWQPGDTCYEWQANGMLAGVRTPDGRTVTFGYDALGRRISKRTDNTVHRFGWDGNVVLHEWDTDEARRPRLVTDETGCEEYDGTEKPENLVTWVYDGTSFTPVAKVTNGERYTIVHDYLGTPTQAYDSKGELVWEMLLDVYGKVAECHGDRTLVPFRYQGQYEDEETGLYYNRFRYYSPDMGMYISSDPIGLAGNNPTLYGYVQDVNIFLDWLGLDAFSDWLSKGNNNNSVYVNAPDGANNAINYGGITNNPTRRIGEHAGRFDDIIVLKGSGQLTRNQARAIEEAIIKNQGLKKAGGRLDNAIHSISPKRAIYDDAVAWGEKWLKDNGHGNLLKDGDFVKKGCR